MVYFPIFSEGLETILTLMNLPATKLRGIRGMGIITIPPHPALSYKGRWNVVTLKQSFEESID
jgi:hypothetical protein